MGFRVYSRGLYESPCYLDCNMRGSPEHALLQWEGPRLYRCSLFVSPHKESQRSQLLIASPKQRLYCTGASLVRLARKSAGRQEQVSSSKAHALEFAIA